MTVVGWMPAGRGAGRWWCATARSSSDSDLGPLNVLLHADAVDRLADLLARDRSARRRVGLAGIRSAGHAEQVAAELAARTGARVAVGDDTDAALAGAFRGGPGSW